MVYIARTAEYTSCAVAPAGNWRLPHLLANPRDSPSRTSCWAACGRWTADIVKPVNDREIEEFAHLRRARDFIDRNHAQPLDVPAMAEAALMSPSHFSRRFREAYDETPYSYLMTRRMERAQELLRHGVTVTDACVQVGCTSLGSFSSRFREVTGVSPSAYRRADHTHLEAVPPCVTRDHLRTRRTRVATPD